MLRILFFIFMTCACSWGFSAVYYPSEINGKKNIEKNNSAQMNCNTPTGSLIGCDSAIQIKADEAKFLDISDYGDTSKKDFYYFKVQNNDNQTVEVDISFQPEKVANFEYSNYFIDGLSNSKAGRRALFTTFSSNNYVAYMFMSYGSSLEEIFEGMVAADPDISYALPDLYGSCENYSDSSGGYKLNISTQMSQRIILKKDEVAYVILRKNYPKIMPNISNVFNNKTCDAMINTNIEQCKLNQDVEKFTCKADGKTITPNENATDKKSDEYKCWTIYNNFVKNNIKPKVDDKFTGYDWRSRDCDTYDYLDIQGIKISAHPNPDVTYEDNTSTGSEELPTTLIGKSNWELKLEMTGGHSYKCFEKKNPIKKAELFDGNGKLLQSSEAVADAPDKTAITISNYTLKNINIINLPDANYKKMYLETTCDNGDLQKIFFDARPARIIRTMDNGGDIKTELAKADKLYAQYGYGFEANGAGNASIAHMIKYNKGEVANNANFADPNQYFCPVDNVDEYGTNVLKSFVTDEKKNLAIPVHYDKSDFNNRQIFKAVDVNGKIVEAYNNARLEIIMASKMISKDKDNFQCSEASNECQKAYVQLTGGTNENNVAPMPKGVYTDFGDRYSLQFDQIGPTQIYGHDNTWTIYSQKGLMGSEVGSILCEAGSARNTPNSNGLIGCDIGLSDDPKSDNPDEEVLDFYSFIPAIAKIQINFANSPVNDSYGTDKWTYIRDISKDATLKVDGKDATPNGNPPFESADLNVEVSALGANLANFCDINSQPLKYYTYDDKATITDLIFSGSPKDPKISKDKKPPKNSNFKNSIVDYMQDFSLFATDKNLFVDDLSIYEADIKIDKTGMEYEFKHSVQQYKDAKDLISTSKADLKRAKDSFKGGKSIAEYRVNFTRNDLLARNYLKVDQGTFEIKPEENNWDWIGDIGEIAVALSVKGDLTFVDAAMIAPDFAHNNDKSNVDQAVYLAGYCDSDCDKASIFGEKVPNHITYRTLAFSPLPGDEKSLFDYENATFKEHKAGADMINGFSGNEVSVLLQSKDANKDELEKYCEIFRNCLKLGEDKYGLTFKVFSATENNWHGAGDQGTTILDNTSEDGHKRHRSNSRLGR